MADIYTIIPRLEQSESTEYLFFPGQVNPDDPEPTFERPDTDFPHAPNPHEQSIWFKTYE